ncbi:MAG TPA: 16S rRNA (adenine(1518)-N(6)/adenine(1519)-N(6))-dimethyltransferase RsmA [Cytophagaceae bacterium]
MKSVRAKKHLGQHFLKDKSIAADIVNALTIHEGYKSVLEVGPGMGVLTQFLLEKKEYETFVIDIDKESIEYLKQHFPTLGARIIEGDFLALDFSSLFDAPFAVIGNFPYNISSQIFFKILEEKDRIPEVVGMLQKEVAVRLASGPGNKDYGILSVLLQAFYDIDYLFTVHENVFQPEPKVKSGVIRLKRNKREKLEVSEKEFFKVVKQAFSTRRKTLRNALKVYNLPKEMADNSIFDKRAEQLSVEDFIYLTSLVEKSRA